MAGRPIRYYFGRLNVLGNYKNKREFLLKGLQTGLLIEHRQYNWGFFDVSELNTEFGGFIHGYLVKYHPMIEEEVVVPETHRLTDTTVPNRVIAKSRFFLHIESGLLAYHPISISIENSEFCDRFVELLEENHGGFFVNADIQAIEDEYKIFEAIRRFQSISRVAISLHPSNPSNRDVWKKYDERFKQMRVGSFKEEYESKQNGDGLNVVDDEEVTGKISMADDGYGRADVTGNIDGETKTISTKDNPITASAPGDDQAPESVFESLATPFRNIFRRFFQ